MSKNKSISLEQLKDSMRYVYGDLYKMTDLTDYDNWCGFTYFIESVWANLDKRTNKKRKIELNREPPQYKKWKKLPIIGQLYRRDYE